LLRWWKKLLILDQPNGSEEKNVIIAILKTQEPLHLIVYTKIIHNNILIKLFSGYDLKIRVFKI